MYFLHILIMHIYIILYLLLPNNKLGVVLSKNLYKTVHLSSNAALPNHYLAPKILYENPVLIKSQGKVFRLNCNASGIPIPTIKWFIMNLMDNHYNGYSLIIDDGVFHINSFGTLEFNDIHDKLYSKNFFCSATNIFGTVYSRKSRVPVLTKHKNVLVKYETDDIMPNEKAVFECHINTDELRKDFVVKSWEIRLSGNSAETITKTGGRFSVINVTKVPQLHVRNITKDEFHSLQVRCIPENKYSDLQIINTYSSVGPKENENVYVISSSVSKFDKCTGSDVNVIQGTNVELPWCSHPITNVITWFKSNSSTDFVGERIILNGNKYSLISDRYCNLLIRSVDITDEGFYFVKKDSSEMLSGYVPFRVTVTVKISLDIVPRTVSVVYGHSVHLQCLIHGYPVTEIFWLHNGVYLRSEPVTSVNRTNSLLILHIANVTEGSVGVYQCVAELRSNIDQQIVDSVQQLASIMITEMKPRLISQVPPVPSSKSYASVTLSRDSSNVVSMQCTFNATPKPTIEWYIDDQPIPMEDVIFVTVSESGILTITSTLTIDIGKLNAYVDMWRYGGMYVANATNNLGSSVCQTLVFVKEELRIRDQGQITLIDKQEWCMKCHVISSDMPEIKWFKIKNGQTEIFPDTHFDVVRQDGREVFINSIKKAVHDALFVCNASVGTWTISNTFRVTVAMPPTEIEGLPEEVVLNERSFIEINCKPKLSLDSPWYSWWEFLAYGSTDNKSILLSPSNSGQNHFKGLLVTWIHESQRRFDDLMVPDHVPPFLKYYPDTFGKIRIIFDKMLHMGNLSCVVQNAAGSIRKSFRILSPLIEFELEPPSLVTATFGTTVLLNCKNKPNQLNTTIVWSQESIPLPIYKPGLQQQIYQFLNGTLKIRNVSNEEPLRFLCLIHQESTTMRKSKLVTIYVQVPARIMPMPDRVDVIKTSSYNLTCKVYGDLNNLEIEWWLMDANQLLTKINHFQTNDIPSLTFEIKYVTKEHDGEYKCVARNAYNNDNVERVIRLQVVAVPDMVQVLEDYTDSRLASIKWQEPFGISNAPIIDYLITWQTGIESFRRNVSTTNVTITGLYPNSVYHLSIGARNKVGLGKECNFQIVTKGAEPDGPVLDLKVVTNSSSSLFVTWKPPEKHRQNDKFITYEIWYRNLTRNEFMGTLKDLKWNINLVCIFLNVTELLLTDLPKFAGFAFQVRAVNQHGAGPFSCVKESTMEDIPEKSATSITCTSQSTIINLQWNPPPLVSINGILLKYNVKYFLIDHLSLTNDFIVDNVFKPSLQLESLVPYSNYSIQVAVYNRIGSGPWSKPVICATKQGSPSPPEKVKAIWYNGTCMLVVWIQPLRSNGIISQYCINISKLRNHICQKVERKQSYYKQLICQLRNRERYKVTVNAYTTSASEPRLSEPVESMSSELKIVSIGRNIVAADRSTVILECETIYGPRNQTWYYYSEHSSRAISILSTHYNYQLQHNGSLVIRDLNASSSGRYQCNTSRTHSITYVISVKVVKHGAPHRPRIYYNKASTFGVFIVWRSALSPRSDDPIKMFLLEIYKPPLPEPIKVFNISYDERSFNISDLQCGSLHNLTLYSVNSAGRSTAENVSIRTLGREPQWANSSQLLAAHYAKSLCFRLSAFHPGHDCPPDKYIITVTSSNNGFSEFEASSSNITVFHKDLQEPCNNVSSLNPDTEYSFEIQASNNAGNTSNKGRAKTSHLKHGQISIKREYNLDRLFWETNFHHIILSSIISIIIIIAAGLFFYCRRNDSRRHQNTQIAQNNIQTSIDTNVSMNYKARRLPELPTDADDCAVAITVPRVNENDEELQPYCSYIPFQSSEFRSLNQGDNNRNLLPSSTFLSLDKQQPTTSLNIVSNEPFVIQLTQPLLSSKDSTTGQEVYRGSSSIYSKCTTSSTKELEHVFNYPVCSDMSSRLLDSDRDNCSTLRPNDPSTIFNQIMRTDDITYRESCSDSCSSDDPGIQTFTQELCVGQQAIAPRFTRSPPPFAFHHTQDPAIHTEPAPLTEVDESENFEDQSVTV